MQTNTSLGRYSPPFMKVDTIPKPGGLGCAAFRKAKMLCCCSVSVRSRLCILFGC
jgi:hypothetical protein